MQARPPAVIIVAEVEHIGRSRLDRHLLGGDDVVDVGRRHHEVERLVGVGVLANVSLAPQTPAENVAHSRLSAESRTLV